MAAVIVSAACVRTQDDVGQSSAQMSSAASLALGEMRAAFKLRVEEPVRPMAVSNRNATHDVVREVLRKGDEASFPLVADGYRFDKGGAKARVTVPLRSDGALHLATADGVYDVTIQPKGLASVAGNEVDGYLVYPQGAGSGHLAYRSSVRGVEDFRSLSAAPPGADVGYDITLGKQIAGLRLVEGSLELLDARGVPRLRVAHPFLVDANGKPVHASLSVVGCAYDKSPAPPWGRPVTSPGAGVCTVHLTWDNQGVAYPALLDPSWTTTDSMTEARYLHTATLLDTGKILVVGGYGDIDYAGAELYDPDSGTWATTGAPSTKRAQHGAALLGSGKVLIAGGNGSGYTVLSSAELYDPSAGTWSTTGSMGTTREFIEASVLSTGKVLVAGGYDGSDDSLTAELYDPSAGTWSNTGSMSHKRSYYASAPLPSDSILVTGGFSSTSDTATAELYDPGAGSWSAAGSMSSARFYHAAVTTALGVVVAGGFTDLGSTALDSVDLYSVSSNSWSAGPSLSTARGYVAGTILQNGDALFAGGYDGTSSLSSVDRLNPFTGSMVSTSSMSDARAAFTLTPYSGPSWGILAAGGYGSSGLLSSAEVYDPTAGTSSAQVMPGDPGTPSYLAIDWNDANPTGNYNLTDTFTVTVKNNSDETRYAHVDLVGTGLDQRTAVRSAYQNVTLSAHSSTTVSIEAGDFPMRSVGVESDIIAEAREYSPSSGADTGFISYTEPYFVEFNATYTTATLHGIEGADLDRTQPTQSTTQSQFLTSTSSMVSSVSSRQGEVWDDDDGAFVDVTTLTQTGNSVSTIGSTYVARGQWAADFEALYPSFTTDYTPGPNAVDHKICAKWFARFEDAKVPGSYQDDYLRLPSNAPPGAGVAVPARYARTMISTAANEIAYVGNLDADGCVTVTLDIGNFVIWQEGWLDPRRPRASSSPTARRGSTSSRPTSRTRMFRCLRARRSPSRRTSPAIRPRSLRRTTTTPPGSSP